MIQLIDIRKTHINNRKSHVEALKGINLDLPDKGFVLIVGGNGSGKSTLLSILGGLDSVTSGQFIVNGQDIAKYSQNQLDNWRGNEVSYVFQDNNLLSDFTVADNIKLGRALAGETVSDEEVTGVLERVRLDGFETRFPKDLSGGERQKVAVARALIKKPRIILVDEPVSAADPISSKNALQIFRDLSSDVLVICVTHNENFIKEYADRVVTIHDGLIANDLEVTHAVSKQPLIEMTLNGKKTKNISVSPEANVMPQPEKAIDVNAKRKETKKIMFGMGIKNLKNNWTKALLTAFVITFSLIFFTVSVMMAGYNHYSVLADDAYGKHPYYAFSADYISSAQTATAQTKAGNTKLYNYIAYGYDGVAGIIELPSNGLSTTKFGQTYTWKYDDGSDDIYGIDELGVVITDYLAEMIVNGSIAAYDEFGFQLGVAPASIAAIDENVYIKLNNVTPLGGNVFGAVYPIHGIVATDYHTQNANTVSNAMFEYKLQTEYAVVYAAKGFAQRFLNNYTQEVEINTMLHLQGIGTYYGSVAQYTVDGSAGTNPNTGGGSLAVSAVGDNDVVVSKALWDRIKPTVTSDPITITLQINNGQSKTYNVKGRYASDNYGIMLNENNYLGNSTLGIDGAIQEALFPTTKLLTTAKDLSYDDLTNLIQTIELGTELKFASANSTEIQDFSNKILLFQTLFVIFALFALVFAGIHLYSYVSTLIANKKKDIGILRSLGAKSNTVFGIFLTTVSIIAAAAVIFSIIGSAVAAVIVNNAFASFFSTNVTVAAFSLWHTMAIIGTSLIIALAATFAPVYQYSNQPPVKQLKG